MIVITHNVIPKAGILWEPGQIPGNRYWNYRGKSLHSQDL